MELFELILFILPLLYHSNETTRLEIEIVRIHAFLINWTKQLFQRLKLLDLILFILFPFMTLDISTFLEIKIFPIDLDFSILILLFIIVQSNETPLLEIENVRINKLSFLSFSSFLFLFFFFFLKINNVFLFLHYSFF